MWEKRKRQITAILAAASLVGLTACESTPGQQVEAGASIALSEASTSEQQGQSQESMEQEVMPEPTVEDEEPEPAPLTLDGRMDQAASRFGAMSCAQALATSYAELVGLEEDTAMDLAAGFGLGMGRRETCGAVTVMAMYAGLGGGGDQISGMINAFEEEMGSILCRDFLDEYGYGNCTNCIRCAASLLETRVFGEMASQDGSLLDNVAFDGN